MEYIDALFPIGTVLAIREPLLKKATQGPLPIIRVDSPSDVILVTPLSSILSGVRWKSGSHIPRSLTPPATADGWKALGNVAFKAKYWLPAAIAYTKGLVLDSSAVILQSNRAEAYLRLGYLRAALKDAEDVINRLALSDPGRAKGLLRAAKANYALGNHDEAEVLLILLRDEGSAETALPWLEKVHTRQREKRTQNYDWVEIFSSALKTPRIDVCDYTGPIEVVSMKTRGGGRGIQATLDMKCGELLVSTAVALASANS
jgi:tetratricopeptide (TPR) repeat protein